MSARNPTYPGVYILELPSGVRTITGVSTSITAFIGRALKGPINDPVIISSFAAYEQIFGGLWRESNMSYAVYQYFQNGGRDAVILRVHKVVLLAI
jgi:phage tail sheath protein FI